MNEKEFETMNKEFSTKEIEIIMGTNVLEEDILILDELGFFWSDGDDECFKSFRFGSA